MTSLDFKNWLVANEANLPKDIKRRLKTAVLRTGKQKGKKADKTLDQEVDRAISQMRNDPKSSVSDALAVAKHGDASDGDISWSKLKK